MQCFRKSSCDAVLYLSPSISRELPTLATRSGRRWLFVPWQESRSLSDWGFWSIVPEDRRAGFSDFGLPPARGPADILSSVPRQVEAVDVQTYT